jgi:chromosome segregation ATPase
MKNIFTENKTLTAEVKRLNGQLLAAEGEVKELKEKLENKRGLIEGKVEEIKGLKATIEEKDAEIKGLKGEVEQLPEKIEEAAGEKVIEKIAEAGQPVVEQTVEGETKGDAPKNITEYLAAYSKLSGDAATAYEQKWAAKFIGKNRKRK